MGLCHTKTKFFYAIIVLKLIYTLKVTQRINIGIPDNNDLRV